MSTFTYHQDPGHGWLEVTLSDINKVGLLWGDFSRYSYHDGPIAYLEEDCDMAVFMTAYMGKHGRLPELRDHYVEKTFIRDLPHLPR